MSKFSKLLIAATMTAGMTAALAAPAAAQGGFYGKWFYYDGTQQSMSRAVAGAAPNQLATGAGVRCEYRYTYQNGQRVKFQYCE